MKFKNLLLPTAILGVALTASAQEDCVNVTLETPVCTTNNGFLGWAYATSCEATLTNLTVTIRPVSDPSILLSSYETRVLEANGEVAQVALSAPGQVFPQSDGFEDHPEYYSNMLWTAVALDNQGRVATVQILVHYDFSAPVLNCPDIIVTATNGSTAIVDFTLTTSSDAILDCNPPSGSVFPLGTNLVSCVARDLCYNTNACTFQVIVLPPAGSCLLHVEIAQPNPLTLTLTWDCAGTLESAPGVGGPWSDVTGASSPYPAPVLPGNRFFRVRRSLP